MDVQLEDLATKSVDELLSILAAQSTVGGIPLDEEHRRRIGSVIFDSLLGDIRKAICPKSDSLASSASDAETAVRDAAFIMDLLLSLKGDPPLATLSMLVVKYGVSSICERE